MRPLLLPALRRLWRDSTTLQLGVDPDRALVLSEVDAATTNLLGLLDGRRTLDELMTGPHAAGGMEPSAAAALIHVLTRGGAVVDGEPTAGLPDAMPPGARRRLQPDLAALSLAVGSAAGAVLARRSRSRVEVRARGRIGPVIAAAIAASGVRRVHVRGSGRVSAGDVAVGGLLPSDEHRPYVTAAVEAILRAAPDTDTRPMAPQCPPDLIILAEGPPGADPPRDRRRSPAQLPVSVRDGTAIIGPLVVAGVTSCLGCMERYRLDRDPAWPAIAAQLATSSPDRADPCQGAVATAAAGIATMQALCYLDGGRPESLGRSLELAGPAGGLRARSWPRHAECPCAALQSG